MAACRLWPEADFCNKAGKPKKVFVEFEKLPSHTHRENIQIRLHWPSCGWHRFCKLVQIEQVSMTMPVNAQDKLPEGSLLNLRIDMVIPGINGSEFFEK